MIQAIVDRFEGSTAVLLIDDQPFDVPRSVLPKGTREGDFLQVEIDGGQIVATERDEAATEAAKKRIAEKLDRLRRGEHLPRGDEADAKKSDDGAE